MAICEWCDKEMLDAKTVTCSNAIIVFPDNESFNAVPFKSEQGARCHDCNIASGGFHHPGCDMEICPDCGGQLISCGCLDEDDEEIS